MKPDRDVDNSANGVWCGLSQVREHARRTVCKSQLAQIGIGLKMYAQDSRDFLPVRGSANYAIRNGGPGRNPANRVNVGMLYGKYVGKDAIIFYCPSSRAPGPGGFLYGINDTMWGLPTFLIDPAPTALTEMSYSYAWPVATPRDEDGDGIYELEFSPRDAGAKMYKLPDSDLAPAYLGWRDQPSPFLRSIHPGEVGAYNLHAELSDDIVETSEALPIGLGHFTHRTGYNVLNNDYHVQWVPDPKQYVAKGVINSGSQRGLPTEVGPRPSWPSISVR
ncbi:DUF1559 domain-containing protein [Pirellulales bacterium]|nr:DUF1559 domain-containing protein [Pirellulales bacterium]